MSDWDVRGRDASDPDVALERRLVTAALIGTLTVVTLMMAEEALNRIGGPLSFITSRPPRHLELFVLMLAAVLILREVRRLDGAVLVPLLGILFLLGVAALRHGSSAGPAIGMASASVTMAVAARLDGRRIERIVTVLLVGLLVLSLGLFIAGTGNVGASRRLLIGPLAALPDIGRARGVFTWASDLGVAAGLLILVTSRALGRRTLRRSTGAALIGLGVVTIIVADALTVALALVVALGAVKLVALNGTRLWLRRRSFGVATGLAAAVMAFPLVVAAIGRPSLTGRTELWQRIVEEVDLRSLIVGYGHRPLARQELGPRLDIAWGPGHAHNTGMDIALAVGILGAVLYFLLLVVMLTVAVHITDVSGGWAAGFVVFWVLNGLTEAQFDRLRPSLALTHVIVLLLVLSCFEEHRGAGGLDRSRPQPEQAEPSR